MNFKDLLINSKCFYASRTAIIDRGRELTYQQLYDRSCTCASALVKAGAKAGDHICIACRNCAEYLEIMFACSMIGAVPCLINWRIPGAVIADMIQDAEVKIIFLSSKEIDAIQYFREWEKGNGGKLIVVQDEPGELCDYEAFLQTGTDEVIFAEPGRDELGMILFTSGTTSRAKGVMISNGALMQQIFATAVCADWYKGERFLCMSPICHSISLAVMTVFWKSGTVILCPSTYLKDCEKIFNLMEEYNVTRMALVPTMLERLVSYAEKNNIHYEKMHVIGYGASPMNVRLIERSDAVFHCSLHQGYGMTETYGTFTALLAEDHKHPELLRSVGRPMIGTRLRIVDDKGNDVPNGVNGEIWVKTETIMMGYLRKPELTAKSFTDGWYHTGDIGYMNNDGYLFLTGRKGDMIITGGENVFPDEVENCILEMSSEVAAVSVVGVPDNVWGELIAAAVVLRSGSTLTESMIMDYCKKRLGGIKRPKKILFVDNLPMTETGKVTRKKVKELFA